MMTTTKKLNDDKFDGNEVWKNVSRFYYNYGDIMYENVSQLDHALQSATQALNDNDNDKEKDKDLILIIGAFLHDIGHLIEYERKGFDNFNSDREHEQIGYEYLKNEVNVTNQRILNSILYHVPAKRYLCYIDDKYYNHLSDASKHTLSLQGGTFNHIQANQFEQIPFYNDAVKIRKWDDDAKLIDAQNVLTMADMKQIFIDASC